MRDFNRIKKLVIIDEQYGLEQYTKSVSNLPVEVMPSFGADGKYLLAYQDAMSYIDAWAEEEPETLFFNPFFMVQKGLASGHIRPRTDRFLFCGPARLEDDRVYGKDTAFAYGLPVGKYVSVDSRNYLAKVRETFNPCEKVVVKGRFTEMRGVCEARYAPDILGEAFHRKTDKEFVVEAYFPHDIELALTFAVNKGVVIPLVTVYDENKLFSGGLGPKFGDTGAVVQVGHPPLLKVAEKVRKLLQDIQYQGFFDIDFLLDSRTGKYIVMEYACRLGCTTGATMFRMLKVDPARLLLACFNPDTTTLKEFGRLRPSEMWSKNFAFNVGMYTMPTAYCCTTGAIASGSQVHGLPNTADAEVFWLDCHTTSDNVGGHVLCQTGGRVGAVVALSDDWVEAKKKAMTMAERIEYINKVHRVDLFENNLINFHQYQEYLYRRGNVNLG